MQQILVQDTDRKCRQGRDVVVFAEFGTSKYDHVLRSDRSFREEQREDTVEWLKIYQVEKFDRSFQQVMTRDKLLEKLDEPDEVP